MTSLALYVFLQSVSPEQIHVGDYLMSSYSKYQLNVLRFRHVAANILLLVLLLHHLLNLEQFVHVRWWIIVNYTLSLA